MKQYNQPKTLPIAEIRDEAEDIKTYFFNAPLVSAPGQFVMLWIPRVNLKPFAVSYLEDGRFGVTVAKIGPATEALFEKRVGEYLGITGPYGTAFQPGSAKRIVLVGGGYGAATVAPLADWAERQGRRVDFIVGARTAGRLIYQERYKNFGAHYVAATHDGSAGEQCRPTDILERYIAEGGVEYVAACGPEGLLKHVAEITTQANIPSEVSIERYMKCGFGVCGACCMDGTGERVCAEGTVFPASRALTFEEFGAYHRARSGKKLPL